MNRSGVAALRAFTGAQARAAERCDFCGLAVGDAHAHVLDVKSGAPRCACTACALLFETPRAGGYRRIAPKAQRLPDPFSASQWSALGIPVGLAWFYRDVAESRLRVRYPGAAGMVEAPDPGAALEAAAIAAPALADLEAGAEALLVRRTARAGECWRVSMDRCWHLAGLLRRHWRGFDGGAEAHAAMDDFFRSLAHAGD